MTNSILCFIADSNILSRNSYRLILLANMLKHRCGTINANGVYIYDICNLESILLPERAPSLNKAIRLLSSAKTASDVLAEQIMSKNYTHKDYNLTEEEFSILTELLTSNMCISLLDLVKSEYKSYSDKLKWCRENAPESVRALSDEEILLYMEPAYDRMRREQGEE